MAARSEKFILWFDEISIDDVALVCGKNASLGEMYGKLTKKGVKIPNGFAITASAYRYLIEKSGIQKEIKKILSDLDIKDVENLMHVGQKIRDLIIKAEFPDDLKR